MLADEIAAHGEDAHLDLGAVGLLEELVGPLDLVQRKGNLLDGFKADDLGNFLFLDRRKLDEAGEALCPLTETAARLRPGWACLKLRQRRLNKRFTVVPGVGQDGFVFDDLKLVNANALAVTDQLDRLQCTIADVDSPRTSGCGHVVSSIPRKPAGECRIRRVRRWLGKAPGAGPLLRF